MASETTVYQLWTDHPSLGCGYRDCFVAKQTDRWVTIVMLGDGAMLKLPAEDLRKVRKTYTIDRRRTKDRCRSIIQFHETTGRRITNPLREFLRSKGVRVPAENSEPNLRNVS